MLWLLFIGINLSLMRVTCADSMRALVDTMMSYRKGRIQTVGIPKIAVVISNFFLTMAQPATAVFAMKTARMNTLMMIAIALRVAVAWLRIGRGTGRIFATVTATG